MWKNEEQKMSRKKLWTKTAEQIKCKYTGIKLTEADSKRDNSRAFYKLPNGEYLSRSSKAMKEYLDETFPEKVEHDGHNVDKDGEPLLHEKYSDTLKWLYDKK